MGNVNGRLSLGGGGVGFSVLGGFFIPKMEGLRCRPNLFGFKFL